VDREREGKSVADDALKARGNTLEEEFFRKQNAELLERLRATQASSDSRSQMAAISGVQDPALLDQLIDHGVTPATMTALALVPLVAVAWADRKLDEKEKTAVLQEAAASGLQQGSDEHGLLEGWLAQEPPASLMTTWSGYAREMSGALEAEQRREFREALLHRATAVANAAGGFAGRGKTSPEEQRVLDAIQSALGA
jgi:tellurite resistance protein